MPARDTKRILFIAENVTTAQVSRLASLASHLPSDRFEVHFAAAEFSPTIFSGSGFQRHRIDSLPREQMLSAVAAGKQVYDTAVLSRYLEEERSLRRSRRCSSPLPIPISSPLPQSPTTTPRDSQRCTAG